MISLISVPPNTPDLSMVVPLEGQDFTIRLFWNVRGGWYIGVADADESPIFSPVALVLGRDFFATVRFDARTPTGSLMALSLSSQEPPGYTDLMSGTIEDPQGRVGLYYLTADEFA